MTKQEDLIGGDTPQTEASLVGQDLSDVPETKWAPMLANLVGVLEATFRRRGHDDDDALRLACDGVLAIAEYGGGRVMYLPRGDRLRIALRDAEIHRRWQGGVSIPALAAAHDITEIHVYRIVAEQRRLYLGKAQGQLFMEQQEGG